MDRRTFLKRGLAISAPAALLGSSQPLWAETAPIDSEKMKRIGCTTVCFRPRFPSTRANKKALPGDLTLLDVPRMFAAKLGVHHVELWSRHFPESSPAYCRRVKTAAERAGSQIINIQLDEPGYNLSDPDAAVRKKGIALVKQWMDRAAICGATSLRANTGGSRTQKFNVALTGDAYAELAEHGKTIGVKVLIENHGGYSSDPDNIMAIIKHVNDPFCRTLPDFGNIPGHPTPDERLAYLAKLFPYAHLVSAKGMVFDEEYVHTAYDIGACVRLGEKAGFRGIYSVELWAPNYYPPDPVRAIGEMVRTITANI